MWYNVWKLAINYWCGFYTLKSIFYHTHLKILRYLQILYIAYNHMQSCECKTMTHGYRKIAFSKYYRCVHVFEVIFKSLFLRIIRVITIQKKLFEKNFFFSSTHFVTLYQTNNNSSNLLVYVEAGF